MGHTVMCVCTVYFTAIVGCAFSSPRLTSGESQQDSASDKEIHKEADLKEIAIPASNDSEVKNNTGKPTTMTPNLEDPGGGQLDRNATFSNNTDLSNKNNTSKQNKKENIVLDLKQIENIIKSRHLEATKEQILTKLRLPFPLKLREPMPILPMKEIENVYFQTRNDAKYRKHSNYFAKTVRKFIPGKDVTQRCYKKSTGCYFFDLRGRVDPSEVQTVQLWIYKLFNHNNPYIQTFIISELEKVKRRRNNLRIKNLEERFETSQKYGWLKIDVTKTAMKWLLKPTLNHGMAVICKDCQQKNYKRIFSVKRDSQPFLVITTRKAHRRERRSYDNRCTDTSTECCLMPFTINFRDIGWDAIAYPHSIQVNYCTGSCHDRIGMTTNHSSLIQTYRWSAATDKQMGELTPCCSPVSYRAQSLLYYDGDKLQETLIPNIAVTGCGCL